MSSGFRVIIDSSDDRKIDSIVSYVLGLVTGAALAYGIIRLSEKRKKK